MVNDILTKQFSFEKFPKPVPKKKERNLRDFGWNSTIKKQKHLKSTDKLAHRRPIKVKKVRLPKEKTRSQLIKILDDMVSNFILVKVCKGKCMRCGKKHTQYENKKGEMKWDNYGCSHYWARDYMGARFEEDNLDGLCWLPCHSQKWEHDKNGQYRDYMLKKLGKKKYKLLEMKARAVTKFSTQDIKFMISQFDVLYQ